MKKAPGKPGPRLRLVLAPGIWFGPGRAALLEGVAETGSIAAAGRRLGMSYKRAWMLVESMNTHFDAPLVTAAKGGAKGGGAKLTELGSELLMRYRRMESQMNEAIKSEVRAFNRHLVRT